MTRRGQLRLNETINNALTEKYGTLKEAARLLKLKYQRLRQDLSDNRYSEADLKILCLGVGLAADLQHLQVHYAFELRTGPRGSRRIEEKHRAMLAEPIDPDTSGLPATFDYFTARQEQLSRIVGANAEDLRNLFHGLGRRDSLFLSILDEEPIHWQQGQVDATLQKVVAEVIKKGAMIAYLYPSESLSAELNRVGCPALAPAFVRERYEDFRKILRHHLPSADRGRIESQITCIKIDWPVLWFPYFRFAVYHNSKDSGRAWATVTVPITRDGGNEQTDFPIFQLNRAATTFLYGLCRKAVSITFEEEEAKPVGERSVAIAELFKRLYPGATFE